MSHCIEKLPHSCGTKDALQVFEENGKYTGYCFACDKFIADPYNGAIPASRPTVTKSQEQIEKELAEIHRLPTVALPSRGLKKESLEYFNIKVAVSEQDGTTPTVRYFPFTENGQLVGYKAKLIPIKKMWGIGSLKGQKDLFGWEQAVATGAKRLYITEGEDDAVALFQALKEKQIGTKFEQYSPAVVSVTKGSTSAKKDIAAHLNKIKTIFKEVVLVFDNDGPGDIAKQAVISVFPTALTVSYPEKDPNECVLKGKSLALANACLFSSESPKNTRIVLGSSLYEAGRTQAEYGLSYPWAGLTKLTRGMRFGETYYLGAGVKMGKSELRNSLAAHLITEHNIKVFMAAPEEINKKTWQMVCGKVVGKVFHDPEVEFDFEAYDNASQRVGESLYLLNLYQHMGWNSLRDDIILAASNGCKAVFIDPITNLTNGISSSDANTTLQGIAQDISALALDHGLIVWLFCHLKAPDSGETHERGGKVLSAQFAGSRAMMRSCNMMVGLEGNKDPDLEEEERRKRRLVILEDREFGSSGHIDLYYNRNGIFTEVVQ